MSRPLPRRTDHDAKTKVHMCNDRVPVKYWTDAVKYDAWARPYVTDGDRMMPFVVALRPSGETDRKNIRWKLKTGPDVKFPARPQAALEGVTFNPAPEPVEAVPAPRPGLWRRFWSRIRAAFNVRGEK